MIKTLEAGKLDWICDEDTGGGGVDGYEKYKIPHQIHNRVSFFLISEYYLAPLPLRLDQQLVQQTSSSLLHKIM